MEPYFIRKAREDACCGPMKERRGGEGWSYLFRFSPGGEGRGGRPGFHRNRSVVQKGRETERKKTHGLGEREERGGKHEVRVVDILENVSPERERKALHRKREK